MYSMSSDLMTSTMKSDPAGPPTRGSSGGNWVSAAASLAEGNTADGVGRTASDCNEVPDAAFAAC